MVCQGESMLMCMPMYMSMQGNYIGTNRVPANTIFGIKNQVGMGPGSMGVSYLRMVPDSMEAQMHMLGASYGLTDAINLMVMGSYVEKDMTMTTYPNPMSMTTPLARGITQPMASATYPSPV